MDQPFLDPNWHRVALVRQNSKFGDDIPSDVDRLVEVEPTIVVSTDNEFYGHFFCSTKACHQGCVGIVKDDGISNFFSGLGHSLVDEGPLLNLSPEFLPLALLYFGILDVFQPADQGCIRILELFGFGRCSGEFGGHGVGLVRVITGFLDFGRLNMPMLCV